MSTETWHSYSASGKQLDKQFRAWEGARQERLANAAAKRTATEDCIFISREVGAGGSEIARLLGEKLGWAVFDRELLHMMAGDDATRERVYATMDERDTSWFETTLRSFADPEFRKNDYLHKLAKCVLSIARQGHAVFLGRGVNRLLPIESILSVRLVAPLDVRVTRLAERRGLDKIAARREVDKLDAERASFVQRTFHVRVDDPSQYDLVINTSRYNPTASVELIVQGLQLKRGS